MLRIDGEFVFYKIQIHYSEWDKWFDIGDKYYSKQYEFGEYSACGKCWQEIWEHGIYDFGYAKQFCNHLNEEIRNGNLKSTKGNPTEFRIVKCEVSQKCTPIEKNNY